MLVLRESHAAERLELEDGKRDAAGRPPVHHRRERRQPEHATNYIFNILGFKTIAVDSK